MCSRNTSESSSRRSNIEGADSGIDPRLWSRTARSYGGTQDKYATLPDKCVSNV